MPKRGWKLHLHTITLRNKIFEVFGFAQSSIPLGRLRIYIEVPDFADTSISIILLQAMQPRLILGATFKPSYLYLSHWHWSELYCEIRNLNPLLDKNLVTVGGSYLEICLLFCLKPPLRIYFVDKLNEWLVERAHGTNKFLLNLVKGTHRYIHFTTIYVLINYRYLVLQPRASPYASKRNWTRCGTANQRTLVQVSYLSHSMPATTVELHFTEKSQKSFKVCSIILNQDHEYF